MSCCIENLNTLDPQYSISVFPLLIKVLLAPLFQNFQLLSETTLSCSFLVGVHFAKLIMLAASFVCTLLSSLISLRTGSFENIVLFSAVLNRLRDVIPTWIAITFKSEPKFELENRIIFWVSTPYAGFSPQNSRANKLKN